MLEAINAIQQYVTDVDYQTFLTNGMIRDAVVRNVQVLGEAANRVPKVFREQHSTIEWKRIIRTRHILVHDYFGLDYEIIWRIITLHLPQLRQSLDIILDNEPPGGADLEPV
ncbi:DUF86 domain-containing protein [Spirosoma sp. KUDC1026]|uniref:HepT-like ribonuclease domain-containing protein n=1 Tax=Spirosoma sp. KUDC1026 TaxID=2745947 RepID=UPI00159BD8ED|nr:DUF86 domain-containing protein [Spirosoma sp. KUDC1026]QKZ13260.1 DUF86 domain-containing protein [Spirosoma sp. KUDC1026]